MGGRGSSIGPEDPCLSILEAIVDIVTELTSRYDAMLRDSYDLYNRRRSISDPPITTGTGDPGSYEGHQRKYRKVQDRLRTELDRFSNTDGCDDDDPMEYGLEEEYIQALEFVEKPAPEEPLPKNPNSLLEKAQDLGAEFVDGALQVGEDVSTTILTVLAVIAALLQVPLRMIPSH